MKFVRAVSLALVLLLLGGCASSPKMDRINVWSYVSSRILNLRNSGNGSANTVIADRVMKNGFLAAGAEYGYYTLDMSSEVLADGGWGWLVLGIFSGFSLLFLGLPACYVDYQLTVKLDIISSNMNVIASYSDSAKIRQWEGFYYGDATNKAGDAFRRLIGNVQQKAADDSDSINAELRAAGPIEIGQEEQAASAPSVPPGQSRQGDIVGALNNAAKEVMNSLQERNLKNLKIAIVNISSSDREQSIFVAGELEHLLVQNRFIIVDRSEVDRIRREHDFQLSGDVDDNQIVTIGKFAGAGLVITGSITGSGDLRRLRLRVLDVQSTEVKASASEPF